MLTRREALDRIIEGGTHVFYTPEFANEAQEAFEMKPHIQKELANTRNPKGLFVDGLEPNAVVEGYASHSLAEAIATHLGLRGIWEQMSGRGSRQRAATDAIDRYLKEQTE